jgi:two-component system KDP operon response regulator KdpE
MLAVRSLTSHPVGLIIASADKTQQSIDFFSTLRELTDVPIIALGSSSEADTIVSYLDNGAVDYLPASTPLKVLAAKVSSRLREREQAARNGNSHILELRDLRIDFGARRVVRGARTVQLTPIEFKLLSVLAQNVERTCSRKMLMEQVWGKDFEDCTHYLRLYVGYLRQKLEPNPARPRYVVTDWGYGYRLTDPQRSQSKAIRHRIAAKHRAAAEQNANAPRAVPASHQVPQTFAPG